MENPFTPMFGMVPPCMAGRSYIISDTLRALNSENRRPELSTIFIGARGTGKTALLSYLAQEARACGWIAVETISGEGLLEDIYQQTLRQTQHLIEGRSQSPKLKSLGIPNIVSVEWGTDSPQIGNWRTRMSDMLDALANVEAGLLISVDEIDDSAEVEQLAAIYQLFVRENRRVSLIMAGLPFQVSSLLSGKQTSFLRRSVQHQLGRIADAEIRDALEATLEHSEMHISTEALDVLTHASLGFPFMMQLVGFRAFDLAQSSKIIDAPTAHRAERLAISDMKTRVLDAALREMTPTDRKFLVAMLEDDASSTLEDVAKRMDTSKGNAAKYRKRLLAQGAIEENLFGGFHFCLPGLREYLLEIYRR